MIAVTGVKGGVGKSTYAVLLARRMKGKVVLCDCDVEAPNLHLLLGVSLRDPVDHMYYEYPEIDESKCLRCGECVKACRKNALFWTPGSVPKLFKEMCIGCGACKLRCPYGAITMKKEAVGDIFVSEVGNITLVTGRSDPRVPETGEMVEQVLEYARNIPHDVLILDTAAGAHCPVVSALREAEEVRVVTEPTPLGYHDLRVALKLLSKLGKRGKVVINKAGIGDEGPIYRIAEEFGAEVIEKVPYSREIIRKYSEGRL